MKNLWIYGITGLIIGVWLLANTSFAVQSDKATYVGPNKCKLCHIGQYKSWQDNEPEHVNALKNLPADKQADPNCNKCHVTGAGKDTGFKDATSTPDLAGVTCEACHGPGSEHVAAAKEDKKNTITRIPVCTTCHNPHVNYKKQYGKA